MGLAVVLTIFGGVTSISLLNPAPAPGANPRPFRTIGVSSTSTSAGAGGTASSMAFRLMRRPSDEVSGVVVTEEDEVARFLMLKPPGVGVSADWSTIGFGSKLSPFPERLILKTTVGGALPLSGL